MVSQFCLIIKFFLFEFQTVAVVRVDDLLHATSGVRIAFTDQMTGEKIGHVVTLLIVRSG